MKKQIEALAAWLDSRHQRLLDYTIGATGGIAACMFSFTQADPATLIGGALYALATFACVVILSRQSRQERQQ